MIVVYNIIKTSITHGTWDFFSNTILFLVIPNTAHMLNHVAHKSANLVILLITLLQFKKGRWPFPNLLELEGLKVILLELCQWAQKTRIIQSTWQELRTCVKWSYISYQSINYVNWSNASSLLSQVWTIELSNSSALISLMITK